MSCDGGQTQDELSAMLILDDEDIAFLNSIHQDKLSRPTSTSASHEIGEYGADTIVLDTSQFDIRPLFWNDQLIGIPARIRNVCHEAGITTFGELLSVDLTALPGIGNSSVESINYFLIKCADLTPSIRLPLSGITEPLRRLTGGRDVVWGPFGWLHPLRAPLQEANLDASALIADIKPASPAEPDADGMHNKQEELTDLDVPIDLLGLPKPKLRRLWLNGYHTISDLDQASDERLLSIRNFGRGSLDRVRSAINNYRTLSGIGGRKGPDRPQDAIACTSWSSEMSLEEAGLPVALSRMLKRNGYHTVGDLAAASDNQLSSIKGLGTQKLETIRQALGQCMDNTANQSAFSDEVFRLADETKRLLEHSDLLVPECPFRACALPIAQTLINRGEANTVNLEAQLRTIEEPRTASDTLLTLDDWIGQLEQQGGASNYLIDRLAGLTLQEIGATLPRQPFAFGFSPGGNQLMVAVDQNFGNGQPLEFARAGIMRIFQ